MKKRSPRRSDGSLPRGGACARRAVTPFQARVYKELCEVPRGRVISYGELARRVRCRSARAVAQALRLNPFAPRVPCHRVIAATGAIGGFQGCRKGEAIRRKLALLEGEGVLFDSGRIAEPARLIGRAAAALRSSNAPASRTRRRSGGSR